MAQTAIRGHSYLIFVDFLRHRLQTLEKKLPSFFNFQSISILSMLGCKEQRI